jgi:biotin carboxylase
MSALPGGTGAVDPLGAPVSGAPPSGGAGHHILALSFTELQLEPVITAARARGARITLAGDERRFARFAATAARADGRVVVDPRGGDPDAALDILAAAHRADPFTGLFVPADPEVPLAARLAARIGVPWNSTEAVGRVTSKWETRRALATRGFVQPEHHLAADAAEARTIVARGGAWIVKPARGTASEGVSKVSAPAEVERAVANLRAFQPDDPFVVEACVAPMTEYSVEGVFFGGMPLVAGVTAKRTTGPPHFVETGHTVPVALPPDLNGEVRAVVSGGLVALGASHGQFHVEVFVRPAEPPGRRVVFGEGHVRAGGDRITQIWALAGVDLDALAVDAMMGRPIDRLPGPSGAAASRYLVFPPGRVGSVTGVEEAAALPGVVHLSVDVGAGDTIEPVVGNGSRHGRFVVAGETFEEVLALADRVERTVRVRYEDATIEPAAPREPEPAVAAAAPTAPSRGA